MSADHFFTIGKTHPVCEDYADSGQSLDDGSPYAIVSDGCSTGKDTDFGARLMVRAASRLLINEGADSFRTDFDQCVWQAEEWREALLLDPSALYATLLVTTQDKDGKTNAVVYGDGIVAARRRDGSGYDYMVVECSKNAPPYLAYLVAREDEKGKFPLDYFREGGAGIRTTTWHNCHESIVLPVEDEVWTRIGTAFFDPNEDDERVGVIVPFDPCQYDVVIVASDGLQSFQRMEGTRMVPVPLPEIMAEVMAFKGTEGEFVQRRLRRFLKQAAKKGWHHNDDIAVAGITLALPSPE